MNFPDDQTLKAEPRDGMTQAAWQVQHELFERSFVALMELPPCLRRRAGNRAGLRLQRKTQARVPGQVDKAEP